MEPAHQPEGMFMHNADKVIIADDRFCPPHRFPHVWPWQPQITTEPCHVHVNTECPGSRVAEGVAAFRRFHHNGYCKILRCPHYAWMCSKLEEVLAREETLNSEGTMTDWSL